MGEPRDDVAGEEGLLRLPLLPDGALGRPGVDRVHRRQDHRRRARPQRPAAQPLRRHQGRPGASWPRRSAPWTSPPRTSSARAGSNRARCSWSTWKQGRIVDDEELKHAIATAKPYGKWLREYMVPLAEVPDAPHVRRALDGDTLLHRQQAFGYTLEDLKYILGPMGNNGEEALGSMGTDTPLAVLSDRAQPLFNYFKQLFAQVTNPPLDAIREELVTSVLTGAGGEGNLLDADARELPADRAGHADPRQRRARQAQAARRLARVQVGRRCRCSSPPPRGPRGWSGRSTTCSRRAVEAIEAGANLLDPLRPRGRRRRSRRSRRCWRPPGCTTTSSARGCGPAPAWSSSAATPARSTTSPCCSATARGRSTRTSRSRRSTR